MGRLRGVDLAVRRRRAATAASLPGCRRGVCRGGGRRAGDDQQRGRPERRRDAGPDRDPDEQAQSERDRRHRQRPTTVGDRKRRPAKARKLGEGPASGDQAPKSALMVSVGAAGSAAAGWAMPAPPGWRRRDRGWRLWPQIVAAPPAIARARLKGSAACGAGSRGNGVRCPQHAIDRRDLSVDLAKSAERRASRSGLIRSRIAIS